MTKDHHRLVGELQRNRKLQRPAYQRRTWMVPSPCCFEQATTDSHE